MVRTILTFVLAVSVSTAIAAGPSRTVDWLTTFEIAPGDTIAVWSLVDSFALWPSSFDTRSRAAYDAGHLEDARYMFTNKGDYLRAIVYLAEGSTWILSSDIRVVFHYPEQDLVAGEILFPTAARDVVRISTDGVVLGRSPELARSRDGGFCVYLRFPPGSLPRPAKRWIFGGNRWGVVRPESCTIRKGDSNETVCGHHRRLSVGARASDDGRASELVLGGRGDGR
jgi:hypothetical protein